MAVLKTWHENSKFRAGRADWLLKQFSAASNLTPAKNSIKFFRHKSNNRIFTIISFSI
jgi:hypothetical protein